jgi:hypothetical protein
MKERDIVVSQRDVVINALRAARTEEAVIAILQEYVSGLAAHELAVIPIALTATAINSGDKVAQMAMVLAQREVMERHDPSQRSLLKDATMIFAAASARLSALGRKR